MAVLADGVSDLFQGPNALVWGRVGTSGREPPEHAVVHVTCRFVENDGATVNMWTGPGRLLHGGISWDNVPYSVFSVGNFQEVRDIDDRNRTGVQLLIPVEGSGRLGGQDLRNRVDVTIRPVFSADGGETWHWINQIVRGVMSDAEIVPGPGAAVKVFRFEVATLDSDVDRGVVQYYNTEGQEREGYPGDRFFEHVNIIAQGKRLDRWPVFVS